MKRKVGLISFIAMLCSSLSIFCIGFASWKILPTGQVQADGSFSSYDVYDCTAEFLDTFKYDINGFVTVKAADGSEELKNCIRVRYRVDTGAYSHIDSPAVVTTLEYLGGNIFTKGNVTVKTDSNISEVGYNGNSITLKYAVNESVTVTNGEAVFSITYEFKELNGEAFWTAFGKYFMDNSEFTASARIDS